MEHDQRLIQERIGTALRFVLDRPRELERVAPALLELLPDLRSPQLRTDLVRSLGELDLDPRLWVNTLKALKVELEKVPRPQDVSKLSGKRLLAELRRSRAEAEASGGVAAVAWAVSEVLRARATDSVCSEIIEILQDPAYGRARQMLPYALEKIDVDRESTLRVLIGLLGDPDITVQVIDVLGRSNAKEALTAMEPFLSSEDPVVRKEAEKALGRLKKGSASARHARLKDRVSLDGLHEASAGFDLDRVPAFLGSVAELVDGFGPDDAKELESCILAMELDEEVGYEYRVTHGGTEALLFVQLFLDDIDAPDIAFFSDDGELIRAVDELM